MSIPIFLEGHIYNDSKYPKTKSFKSCALWEGFTDTSTGDNITTDTHYTKEGAEAVCRGLEREGFGGEGIYFPIKTWVEKL